MALLLGMAATPALAADAGVNGIWLDQSGRGGIDIQSCGDKLCGNLVWLKEPLNPQGKPKTDIHNPDTALQSRPLCDVPILSGFTQDSPNHWTGGTIYDAASGKTYKSNMELQPDGTLHVRGYVGFTFLGRTETWTRPPSALQRCK
jgi:uncharacterized protein (DUF2147 family)